MWMAAKGDTAGAAVVLCALRGYTSYDVLKTRCIDRDEQDDLQEELQSMPAPNPMQPDSPGAGDTAGAYSILDLLKDKGVRRALTIAVTVAAGQQLSGINNIFNYIGTFLAQNGIDSTVVTVVTVCTNVISILCTGVATYLMDVSGRRVLLLASVGGMLFFTILLTFSFQLLDGSPAALGPVVAVAACSYVGFFAIGFGPIPWLLPPELFTTDKRSTATGFAALCNWFANFCVALTFPLLSQSLKGFAFVPNAFVLLAVFVFVYLYVPETKGKTIMEIQDELIRAQIGNRDNQYGARTQLGGSKAVAKGFQVLTAHGGARSESETASLGSTPAPSVLVNPSTSPGGPSDYGSTATTPHTPHAQQV